MNKLVDISAQKTFQNITRYLMSSKHLWEESVTAEANKEGGIRGLCVYVPPYEKAINDKNFQINVMTKDMLENFLPNKDIDEITRSIKDDFLILMTFNDVMIEETTVPKTVIVWELLNKSCLGQKITHQNSKVAA